VDALEAVRRNLCTVIPDLDPAAVTPDRGLADLGCNSIDRADVVTMTMADLGIEVPVMEFAGVTDVGSLVALFHRYTR
jgi:polyketide biosynthesis acyl carrier protein